MHMTLRERNVGYSRAPNKKTNLIIKKYKKQQPPILSTKMKNNKILITV